MALTTYVLGQPASALALNALVPDLTAHAQVLIVEPSVVPPTVIPPQEYVVTLQPLTVVSVLAACAMDSIAPVLVLDV